MKKELLRRNLKTLSPKDAFQIFTQGCEKMFISDFYHEAVPIKDIRKMCQIYSREVPEIEDILFTDEEIRRIEDLLVEHLESYVESKGGMENLDLYTEEELDEMWKEVFKDLMEVIKKIK